MLSGELRAGQRIRERELAVQLGISTTPVKDALRRLEAESLIITLPRRGTFVTNFTFEAFREAVLIRGAIEGAIAHLAAVKVDETGERSLASCLQRMRAAVLAADTDGFLRENETFHETLLALADNVQLERIARSVRLYADVVRRQLLPQTGDFRSTLRDHKEIIDAVVAHEPTEAEAAMRRHVERGLRRFVAANREAKYERREGS